MTVLFTSTRPNAYKGRVNQVLLKRVSIKILPFLFVSVSLTLICGLLGIVLPNNAVAQEVNISLGDKGEVVKLIQKKLNIRVTGVFDADTAIAIADFQRENGRPAYGFVNRETLLLLDVIPGQGGELLKNISGRAGVKTTASKGAVIQVSSFIPLTEGRGTVKTAPITSPYEPYMDISVSRSMGKGSAKPVPRTNLNPNIISTNSGIGLNVRSGPGLSFPAIGYAEDGNILELVGSAKNADGYTWQRVSSGGWVAKEYVDGGFVNISTGNSCLRGISACGGDSIPSTRPVSGRPVVRPTVVNAASGADSVAMMIRQTANQTGLYTVVVPGGDAARLKQIKKYFPTAFSARAQAGSFINAGRFNTYDLAQAQASYLRTLGFDARVYYNP